MVQKLDADMIEDGVLAAKLDKAGGTMTGALLLSGAPSTDLHAATKKYVDETSGASFIGFSAYKGSDQTGIATATATKVTFTTEEFDVGGYYDAANSKFTPPAGKYLIGARYHFTAGTADQGYIRVYLYKNGTLFKSLNQQLPASGSLGIEANWLVDANGTDYFEIYAYGATASSLTIGGGASVSGFWACRVG